MMPCSDGWLANAVIQGNALILESNRPWYGERVSAKNFKAYLHDHPILPFFVMKLTFFVTFC